MVVSSEVVVFIVVVITVEGIEIVVEVSGLFIVVDVVDVVVVVEVLCCSLKSFKNSNTDSVVEAEEFSMPSTPK